MVILISSTEMRGFFNPERIRLSVLSGIHVLGCTEYDFIIFYDISLSMYLCAGLHKTDRLWQT